MTTRREVLLAGLVSLWAPFVPAFPERAAPLEVTYYYLPG